MASEAVTILQVFRRIRELAAHHLDDKDVQKLEAANSAEQALRNRATSGLTKVFNKRFKRLKKALLADMEADRRWLTTFGKDVFNGWPDWQVEHDDEECEGLACRARRRPVLGAAETDGGNTSSTVSAEGASASGDSG